ncbi:MAG: phosphotransferase [Actinomycetota bacterium]
MEIPHELTDITAPWIDEALGVPGVTAIEVTDIGEGTGIFGQLARVSVTADGDAPSSVVVKLACTEPANLAVAQALGLYQREIAMFEHIVDDAPFRSPTCHLALQDPEGPFALVMEDMSVDYEVGDQVVGATLEQAETIVDAVAGLHAQWWERPELEGFDWLPVPNAPTYLAAVPGIYRAGVPVFVAEWADRVPAAATDLVLQVEPRFEEILDATAGGPRTLIHGDTRLDNFFFPKDGSNEVAFIDFQLALQGRGASDIAYLLMNSVPTEIAADQWENLLRRWLDRLGELGVSGYDLDDAIAHYRTAALYLLSGAMSLIGTFDSGNERGAAMTEAYTLRSLNHVVDIDAGAVL